MNQNLKVKGKSLNGHTVPNDRGSNFALLLFVLSNVGFCCTYLPSRTLTCGIFVSLRDYSYRWIVNRKHVVVDQCSSVEKSRHLTPYV